MAVSAKITLAFRLEAFAFDRLLKHFNAMPIDRASDAGADWLARLGPLAPAHRTVLNNLRLAYPEESEAWRRALAIAHWAQLGRVAGEFPNLEAIDFRAGDGRAELVGGEILDQVRESGKGAVFISGHFATFEVMARAIIQRGLPCVITYRPANNPLVNARILEIRRGYGVKVLSAKGREGGMGLMRALMRGETVALMNDQKYNEGVAAPFFGHTAMTADGPTRLALRFGVPLIPLSVRRLPGGARFRVTVHEPIAIDRKAPADQAVPGAVVAINRFIEARVREAPEQWFWVHRRWPKEAWAKTA